jgi:hypothetical protein
VYCAQLLYVRIFQLPNSLGGRTGFDSLRFHYLFFSSFLFASRTPASSSYPAPNEREKRHLVYGAQLLSVTVITVMHKFGSRTGFDSLRSH